MESLMDVEHIIMQVARSIKGHLRMGFRMAMEFILGKSQMVQFFRFTKVTGYRTNDLVGESKLF